VALDATISPEGKVTALKAISGHPFLVASVLDAVRHWEYKPFMQDGRAVTAIARIEWSFPSAVQTKSQEAATRDYYPAFQGCYSLVRAQKSADAEEKCVEAVKIADQLPPQRVLERSSSRTFLAHSLLDQGKVEASIPIYQRALDLRATLEDQDRDADFAWDNANLARAYFMAHQPDAADPLYARAITIFEAAPTAEAALPAPAGLPDMKVHYSDGLRTLLEYAKLKDTRGEHDRARKLKQKADAIQVQ
jgi:tetratricopeptide (TPR) repeat protein